MKLVLWVLSAAVILLLMVFAISNRQVVTIGLWPLSFVLDLPLYAVVLATLLIGFVAGEFVAWVRGRHARREVRRRGRRIVALERDLAAARPPLDSGALAPAPSARPMLPYPVAERSAAGRSAVGR